MYGKLAEKEHTTIRKHKEWKLKQLLPEFVKGKHLQDVIVIKKERKLLIEVDADLLMKDTNTNSVQHALDCINSLKIKIDLRYGLEPKDYDFSREIFTIYYLRIVNPMRITDFLR